MFMYVEYKAKGSYVLFVSFVRPLLTSFISKKTCQDIRNYCVDKLRYNVSS